eukprot:6470945-Amphidinium_carterae.1
MKDAELTEDDIEMVRRMRNVRMPERHQGHQIRREELQQDAEERGFTAHLMEQEYEGRAKHLRKGFNESFERQRSTYYKTWTTRTSNSYDEHYIPRRNQNPELLHRTRCTRCTTVRIRRKATTHKSSMKPTEYTSMTMSTIIDPSTTLSTLPTLCTESPALANKLYGVTTSITDATCANTTTCTVAYCVTELRMATDIGSRPYSGLTLLRENRSI